MERGDIGTFQTAFGPLQGRSRPAKFPNWPRSYRNEQNVSQF
jgi:hypothetical protein